METVTRKESFVSVTMMKTKLLNIFRPVIVMKIVILNLQNSRSTRSASMIFKNFTKLILASILKMNSIFRISQDNDSFNVTHENHLWISFKSFNFYISRIISIFSIQFSTQCKICINTVNLRFWQPFVKTQVCQKSWQKQSRNIIIGCF